jgi:hypothetical protein
MITMYPDALGPAYSAPDIERAFGAGWIASLLGRVREIGGAYM